jgi:DNA-binding MarR family transcriptional regulator
MSDMVASLAQRVWRLFFDFIIRTAPARNESLGKRGLTPNDARALILLDAEEGRPMRSLAETWRCDPSNATWIVDRLEKLGLAERRTVAHDRRVKLVALTARGSAVKSELQAEYDRPPPELARLDAKDLRELLRILTKLGG